MEGTTRFKVFKPRTLEYLRGHSNICHAAEIENAPVLASHLAARCVEDVVLVVDLYLYQKPVSRVDLS